MAKPQCMPLRAAHPAHHLCVSTHGQKPPRHLILSDVVGRGGGPRPAFGSHLDGLQRGWMQVSEVQVAMKAFKAWQK